MGKSPNRRKSIAATTQNKPNFLSRTRRAHSIVPGEKLSPFSKARRSLGPGKSILKLPTPVDSPSNSQVENDANATETMDLTRDYRSDVHDNPSRKSLGARRVSFAHHATVRLFEDNKGTGSPHSSPEAAAPDGQLEASGSQINDENFNIPRRRSSIAPASAVADEDEDEDGSIFDEDEFMSNEPVSTEDRPPRRKSSFPRAPLVEMPQSPTDASYSDAPSDMSIDEDPMNFTVPLERAIKPAHHDDAWVALRNVTHSGSEPYVPPPSDDEQDDQAVDMDLDDGMQPIAHANAIIDDTVSSTDSTTSQGGFDRGDQTMNITKIRESMGSRFSMGSEMEITAVHRAGIPDAAPPVVPQAVPTPTVPRSSVFTALPPAQSHPSKAMSTPASSRVFSAPTPGAVTPGYPKVFSTPATSAKTVPKPSSTPSTFKPKPTVPVPFSFTPKAPQVQHATSKSSISSKIVPPKPSAAFAPPSPKKAAGTSKAGSSSPTKPNSKPRHEPTSEEEEDNASKQSSTLGNHVAKPNPLRRPAGYHAQRKSLGPGISRESSLTGNAAVDTQRSRAAATRMSMGAPSSGDAWTRFDANTTTSLDLKGKGKAKASETTGNDVVESSRLVETSKAISPVQRGSPALSQRGRRALDSPPQPPIPRLDLFSPSDEGEDDTGDMGMDIERTEIWRDGVEEGEPVNEVPPITIQHFFELTDIKFMDEVTAPRRQSIHPSQPRSRTRRMSSGNGDDGSEIALAEYTIAMSIDIPHLVLYSRVTKDLQAWIETSKLVLEKAEDDAAKDMPELFIEFSQANEEGQKELIHQLKLIQTNSRILAKKTWYAWKQQWVQKLTETADKALNELQNDMAVLADERSRIAVPEAEYEQVIVELELEQAEVAEIAQCDQDYLSELKTSIAEQNAELDNLRAEVAEIEAQEQWFKDRKAGLDNQKQEHVSLINRSKQALHVQNHSTSFEVGRLRDELEALETLHMLQISKVSPDVLEFVYDRQFLVSIPCRNFAPIVKKVEISKTGPALKDPYPVLSGFLIQMAQQIVVQGNDTSTRLIVDRLRAYWSSCSQLRVQLKLLKIKYPVEIEILAEPSFKSPAFKAHAIVLFPAKKAKAIISFVFSKDTFVRWPMSIQSLTCEVKVAYGAIDGDKIFAAVSGRLKQASPVDNHGCIFDAIIEAGEQYSE